MIRLNAIAQMRTFI